MANVAIFEPNQTPKYLVSVHNPDYENNPDAIINPDISAVTNVPMKYWKRSGNLVVEMTQAEKDAVSAAELQSRKQAADDFGLSDMKPVLTALIKVINIRLPQNQKITKQELIDALKAEIL